MASLISASPEETSRAGRDLASRLKAGDVVLLSGPLGAGKTCFASGLCQGLGCRAEDVSSPSFTLVNEYAGRALKVYHVDLYRLSSEAALESVGLEDYFRAGGVCLVEWPERLGSLAPDRAWTVALDHVGAESRSISVSSPDSLKGGS
jgi:tRNA threonylcarbamoyl adenosine modification protein YjeE